MGYDTRLYMSNKWNNRDIVDIVHNMLRSTTGKKIDLPRIDIGSTGYGDHFFMQYNREETGIGSMMISESDIGTIKCVMVSASESTNAVALLKAIAEKYGGMFTENDFSDELVEFQGADMEDLDFTLKEIQKGGPYYLDAKKYNEMIDSYIEDILKFKRPEEL